MSLPRTRQKTLCDLSSVVSIEQHTWHFLPVNRTADDKCGSSIRVLMTQETRVVCVFEVNEMASQCKTARGSMLKDSDLSIIERR